MPWANTRRGDLVTWLMPVLNGMPYLRDSLASIAAQTYSAHQIFAWDNGSTDGSREELSSWIPGRIPGKLITDMPLDLADCRANLVSQCSSELCAFLDADDTTHPDRLIRQVDFLEKHPRVAVVGSQMRRMDAESNLHEVIGPAPTSHLDIVCRFFVSNPISNPSVMFRRSAVLTVGNFRRVALANIEDYDMWLRIASRFRMANLKEDYVNWRVHPGSTTQHSIRAERLDSGMLQCFVEHAHALYGIRSEEAGRLKQRRYIFAFPVISRIVKHLTLTYGLREVSESVVLSDVMRSLTRRTDVLTRIILILQQRKKLGLRQAFGKLVKR